MPTQFNEPWRFNGEDLVDVKGNRILMVRGGRRPLLPTEDVPPHMMAWILRIEAISDACAGIENPAEWVWEVLDTLEGVLHTVRDRPELAGRIERLLAQALG